MPAKVDDVDRPLSDQINIATRSAHTKLNKLVILRLPLALPPKAQDATNYFLGVLHIAPIYIAFESLWQNILDNPPQDDGCEIDEPTSCSSREPPPDDSDDFGHTSVSQRIYNILLDLRVPGLLRTRAVSQDLLSLAGWTTPALAKRLDDVAEAPALKEFLTHIRHSVKKNPHVLLAYAWVLYMALFSGGRFIRASLETIPADFWNSLRASPRTPPNHRDSDEVDKILPLQFYRFDTPEDGEDLKSTFKRRLSELDVLLMPRERDDIVQEGRVIFDSMIRLVSELDGVCGTDPGQTAATLRMLTRDSVAVAKERERKAHSAESSNKECTKGNASGVE